MDLGGFILSRGVTHASEPESKAVVGLLEGLPLQPGSLAGDTGHSDGQLHYLSEERDITAYIPIHPRQETSMGASGDFTHHGDHLVCPQGKILRRGADHKRQRAYHYAARQKDCQACPVKDTCRPPGQRPPGERAIGARPSRKELSPRLTRWDGRNPDCAGCGRWTARVTWQR